jgi:catechol 2,3-dioxygenase-like lactoylglutathione lyase family enzyme
MFSHIMVGANDMEKAKTFYDATLGALGVPPARTDDKGRLFYMTPQGIFAVTKPIDGEAATHANGATIGFACSSSQQADAWHAAGVANGGTSIEDPPGVRDGGLGKLYLAYLRDPDGNKLCALHRMG